MHELLERSIREASHHFQNFLIHEYARRGFLHGLDARLKFVATLILVVLAVSTFELGKLLVIFATVIALTLFSGIGFRTILRRSWLFTLFSFIVVLPFALSDVLYVVTFTFRVFIAIAAMQLFVATTPFGEVCAALKYFRVPKVLVDSIWLAYRYVILLFSDLLAILLARESRRVSKGSHLDVWRKGGEAVGLFFLRSFERAERIQLAMVARGDVSWDRNWKIGGNELIFCAIVAFAALWWAII